MEEFCREDNKLVVVQWKDSKGVTIASMCTGCESVENVQRWSKSEKEYITVPCPTIIRRYNQGMGGVDVCDQMMEGVSNLLQDKDLNIEGQHSYDGLSAGKFLAAVQGRLQKHGRFVE